VCFQHEREVALVKKDDAALQFSMLALDKAISTNIGLREEVFNRAAWLKSERAASMESAVGGNWVFAKKHLIICIFSLL
jgi:hypothetical protein